MNAAPARPGRPPTGSFRIPEGHPCFDGHMPGQPIVPGALLLDRAIALIAAAGHTGGTDAPTTIRFFAPVVPGDTVDLRCEPSARGGIAFEGFVGGRRVFAGRTA